MRIEYVCRHCHHQIGEINRPEWSAQDAQRFAGIDTLTQVEQAQNVAYNPYEQTMYIQAVCDHCQRALESHPELLVEGKLLQ